MRITWFAHACFKVEGGGLTVITDPYTPAEAGLEPITDRADVVLMSSALDSAHSNWAMIDGNPRVINALDAVPSPITLAPDVDVSAIATMEGYGRPDQPKANAMYRLTLDGVSICHMGDVGNRLTSDQLASLVGHVDVLLALTGAHLTIQFPDLIEAIDAIGPKMIIPMHYKTPKILFDLATLDEFLACCPKEPVVRVGNSSVEITPADLPDRRSIVVLTPLLG
jgi:L-ascorbate metabolism protein UlaG (beta-lactamase superfamily)